MDFTNFCKKVEMDNIRAKLRTLPSLSTLKNVKLPKSLPKLNSRKIFRSSREDVNKSSKHAASIQHLDQNILTPPPADFIRYTPSRISTISSLVHEESIEYFKDSNTYRSAESVDDDYASSSQQRRRSLSRPISPITLPVTNFKTSSAINDSNTQHTFTQMLQKRYKDMADFKFKHIFAKRTVVRKDNIEVDHYVQRYNEDLVLEKQAQERHDTEIEDNYHIHFTISRQNTIESNHSDLAKPDKIDNSQISKTVGEFSDDESGMDASPPTRKPGIASTRFSKVLKPAKRMSIEYDYEIEETSEDKFESKHEAATIQNSKSRLPLQKASDSPATAVFTHIDEPPTTNNALITIRNNCKRFKNSVIQRQHQQQTISTDESGDEGSPTQKNKKIPSTKTQKFRNQLRKLRSRDDSQETVQENQYNVDMRSNINNKLRNWKRSLKINSDGSPNSEKTADANVTNQLDSETNLAVHTKITNRLQKWKQSLKEEPQTNVENAADKHKRSDTLIKKLKYIRDRKSMNSIDDLQDVSSTDKAESTSFETTKSKNFEEKFNQARKQTFKRVNEKVQQFKSLKTQHLQKRKQDKEEEEEDSVKEDVINFPPTITRRALHAEDKTTKDVANDEIENDESFKMEFTPNRNCTKWTTKPIYSESMDTDDTDNELPRVLIHQDNSDFYESTLIISVTRPASLSPPKITEIMYEDTKKSNQTVKNLEWISNQDIISEFNSTTISKKSINDSRKSLNMPSPLYSLSNDNTFHSASATNLSQAASPWKTNNKCSENKLYKCKSTDIFDISQVSIATAFDNFEEELRNEPVVKISNSPRNFDNKDGEESSEDVEAADDDNSSLVTNFSIKQTKDSEGSPVSSEKLAKTFILRKIGNSQESLLTQLTHESEDPDSDDYDRPPSAAPSPPPSFSPPPPPLPIRRRSFKTSLNAHNSINFNPTPLLPTTKPQLPKNKPLRTNSMQQSITKAIDCSTAMTRISKPLVKTSSLRLTYNEQIKLTDVGKVTKLISRFEQPQLKEEDQQRCFDTHDENVTANQETQATTTTPNIIEDQQSLLAPIILKPPRTLQKSKDNSDGFSLTDVQVEESLQLNLSTISSLNIPKNNDIKNTSCKEINEEFKTPLNSSKNSLNADTNFNYSCPNSEYGSPLTYPSSLIGSPEATPKLHRRYKETGEVNFSKQKKSSVSREADNYYSFDSDEENSYYSISSSSHSHYVVEI